MSNPKIDNSLPKGQQLTAEFSRYGLFQYANRYHQLSSELRIKVGGDVRQEVSLSADSFHPLTRVTQTCDFHCITTWSKQELTWSGYHFKEFFENIAHPLATPDDDVRYVVFRSQDGYRTYFLLEDALAEDVLLADTLANAPLTREHGAPMRLIAPAHYGYRSAKHLTDIEFCRDLRNYRSPAMHWTEHPRARVAFEERGRWLPGIVYRYLFRPIIPFVRWWYRKAAKRSGD